MMAQQSEQPEHDTAGQSTRMVRQPALQTSSGTIWLVMGAIFAACCMIPLAPMTFVSPGASQTSAVVTASLVIACYAAIVAFRIVFRRGARRLRWMAGGLITMAAAGIIGMLVCLWVEQAARLG